MVEKSTQSSPKGIEEGNSYGVEERDLSSSPTEISREIRDNNTSSSNSSKEDEMKDTWGGNKILIRGLTF